MVCKVTVRIDSGVVVAVYEDGSIGIYNVLTGEVSTARFYLPGRWLTSITISKDNRYVVIDLGKLFNL